MSSSWRLLTSHTRKFVHVTLKSSVAHLVTFILTEPKLECDGNSTVSDLNPKNTEHMVSVRIGYEIRLVTPNPLFLRIKITYCP